MRVLIAEADHQLACERARQLQMDGHHASLALSGDAAAIKLAELPDALVLCTIGSPVQTIALLRALRSGEIPGTDASLPILVVGADHDHDAMRYYHGGADIALAKTRSPLLIAAAHRRARSQDRGPAAPAAVAHRTAHDRSQRPHRLRGRAAAAVLRLSSFPRSAVLLRHLVACATML